MTDYDIIFGSRITSEIVHEMGEIIKKAHEQTIRNLIDRRRLFMRIYNSMNTFMSQVSFYRKTENKNAFPFIDINYNGWGVSKYGFFVSFNLLDMCFVYRDLFNGYMYKFDYGPNHVNTADFISVLVNVPYETVKFVYLMLEPKINNKITMNGWSLLLEREAYFITTENGKWVIQQGDEKANFILSQENLSSFFNEVDRAELFYASDSNIERNAHEESKEDYQYIDSLTLEELESLSASLDSDSSLDVSELRRLDRINSRIRELQRREREISTNMQRNFVPDNTTISQITCKICLSKDVLLAFECGHLSCEECATKIDKCHICRKNINKEKNVRIYL